MTYASERTPGPANPYPSPEPDLAATAGSPGPDPLHLVLAPTHAWFIDWCREQGLNPRDHRQVLRITDTRPLLGLALRGRQVQVHRLGDWWAGLSLGQFWEIQGRLAMLETAG